MRITAKFHGNIQKYLPEHAPVAALDLAAETTIAELLARLSVPDSQVWMSAVNDTVVDASAVLHEGDVLEVFEPVGGG
jgi:sulfur carrier protein ThiS